MKLIEHLKLHESLCVDTCDTVFDAIVTIDWDKNEPLTDYPEFQKVVLAVYEKVDLVEVFDGYYAKMKIDWSGFIRNNIKLFREFSNQVEDDNSLLEDDDDFVYSWITYLHYILSGNLGGERYCKKFREMVEKCEYKEYSDANKTI